jgi:hypothetical protein
MFSPNLVSLQASQPSDRFATKKLALPDCCSMIVLQQNGHDR